MTCFTMIQVNAGRFVFDLCSKRQDNVSGKGESEEVVVFQAGEKKEKNEVQY